MSRGNTHVLITGGAGFIGTNLAERLCREGERVLIFDNLARPGVERNLDWLLRHHAPSLRCTLGDVRDEAAVREAVADAKAVFHLAAQVAVTSSLEDPVNDFEINARGTLNVLEAIRRRTEPVPIVYTSTHKVMGGLERIALREGASRYEPEDPALREHGIGESEPLEFCSPYGCSKGAADQYVLDYSRVFRVPAAVFRMSCVYGPHQFGTEDQGWVAHFARQALAGETLTFYGDGKQVSDPLFVDDLVDALLLAWRRIDRIGGAAYAIGGGPDQSVSLRELLRLMALELGGRVPEARHAEWRPSDQRYYVSDIRRFRSLTGWQPRIDLPEGLSRLLGWLRGSGSVLLAREAA